MKKSALDHWIMKTEALPTLTREGLAALQLKKLNETLSRVRARGGAYASWPDHLDSLRELESLPFTTPEQLARSPGKFLVTSQSEVSRVISGATSGTTGPGKRVFYTQADTDHTVGFFAAGIGEMLSPGEKCCIAFPFTGPFGLGDLIAKAVEQLGAIPVKAGFGQTWGELSALIRREEPQAYIGFPVPLLSLMRLYGDHFPIRKALLSADACPAGVMAELSKLGPLYPHYGSRECGLGGAITCPAFEGMHLRENHILAEIVDERGNVLPEGESGELVITTIGLQAMPMLRYRTGDITRFLPPCPCGSAARRIAPVSRREEPLSMEGLDSALFPLPNLVDYRARWDGRLHIEARVLGQVPIAETLGPLYPDLEVTLCCTCAQLSDRPMYLGKRRLVQLG